ncbi:hypothetical protein [Sphingobium sp.]|uniref:YciI family protein n=1 Tax=Sphingobium sp. TaxID=1912891 RepID=UPI0028BE7DFC|nr:hypothetical protein [Sphingobium sp.]
MSPLDQPGAAEHTAYMSRLHDAGNIDCAGPLLTPGAGGMCVLADGVTGEQADAFGREDPGVTGGLITFEVHPWMQVYRSS